MKQALPLWHTSLWRCLKYSTSILQCTLSSLISLQSAQCLPGLLTAHLPLCQVILYSQFDHRLPLPTLSMSFNNCPHPDIQFTKQNEDRLSPAFLRAEKSMTGACISHHFWLIFSWNPTVISQTGQLLSFQIIYMIWSRESCGVRIPIARYHYPHFSLSHAHRNK